VDRQRAASSRRRIGRRPRRGARARRPQGIGVALHGRTRNHDQEPPPRGRAVPRVALSRAVSRRETAMSSHREAPEISKAPVADSTDLYAFVSPDAPDTVTLIANYVPLQGPAGGPNFYEFGDDVLYEINIDNDNDGHVDISFKFSFNTVIEVGGTFLYNVGPISSLDSSSWNRRQFYSVTRVDWERRGRGQGRGERH